MRKLIAYVVGALFLFVSCHSDELQSDEALFNANDMILMQAVKSFNNQNSPKTSTMTLKSSNANRVTKELVFKYSKGTFSVIPNPGYCGDYSPPLQFVVEGTGIASHIGKFTVKNMACVDGQGMILTPLYGFITAANGDVINTVVVKSYPDESNPPYVNYEYAIIGGSEGGRFEGATGVIYLYGVVDYTTGTFYFEGSGEITY